MGQGGDWVWVLGEGQRQDRTGLKGPEQNSQGLSFSLRVRKKILESSELSALEKQVWQDSAEHWAQLGSRGRQSFRVGVPRQGELSPHSFGMNMHLIARASWPKFLAT